MKGENITVADRVRQRFSARAYLDKAVAKETIEQILDSARWSPSGANLQPWQLVVVRGKTKEQLTSQIMQAFEGGNRAQPDYPYYPEKWFEPYQSRRFKTGMALYNALGIERQDKERREAQWKANYDFFGAPVGFIFLVDKRLGHGCWVDMGMFFQSVMLIAADFGLSTCPQAALGDYPDIVRNVLGLPDNLLVMCGMALGYADNKHPVNNYRTERETVDSFTRWFD